MKIYENEKQELVIDKDEAVTYVGENSCVFGSFWTIKGNQYRYIHADPRGIDGCHIMLDVESNDSCFIYLKGMPKERQEFYYKLDKKKSTNDASSMFEEVIFSFILFIIFVATLTYILS